MGDPPLNIEKWANHISEQMGVRIHRVPFSLIKIAGWIGDGLKMLGISFPMTSFRLKNMTTNNILDLSKTFQIAPNPPYSELEGIKRTIEWLRTSKKISMTISIITATYNSGTTVRDTFESVLSQIFKNIEYIVIDGGSTDDTLKIIREYESRFEGRMRWISERDRGLYDAMNKGIAMATGDVVGILNSDDFYTAPDVLTSVAATLENKTIDAVYGDIHFVRPDNLSRCVRYYSSNIFRPWLMRLGFIPAHPSFYCRKSLYNRYGTFNIDYKIAADFEILLRLIYVHRIHAKYLKKIL